MTEMGLFKYVGFFVISHWKVKTFTFWKKNALSVPKNKLVSKWL